MPTPDPDPDPDPNLVPPALELDDSGHWLAGLSAPSLSLGDVLAAQDTVLARKARQMGIGPTDMRALRLLQVHGPLGASELAHLLDVRPASVTTLVHRMSALGLLEQARSDTDRRRVTIHATPHALQRSLEIWAPTLRAMDDLGHSLDPATQRAVCDYLDAVHRVLLDTSSAHASTPGAGVSDQSPPAVDPSGRTT